MRSSVLPRLSSRERVCVPIYGHNIYHNELAPPPRGVRSPPSYRLLISFSIADRSAFTSARAARIAPVGADNVPVLAPDIVNG
jgi:hypothetical protein